MFNWVDFPKTSYKMGVAFLKLTASLMVYIIVKLVLYIAIRRIF